MKTDNSFKNLKPITLKTKKRATAALIAAMVMIIIASFFTMKEGSMHTTTIVAAGFPALLMNLIMIQKAHLKESAV